MGIYTSNRYLNEAHDWASEIPANEAYGAAFGCAQILADCQTNDMALFESTIYSDIAEVRAVQEGYGYVNENAFTDVIKKIVEMFKEYYTMLRGRLEYFAFDPFFIKDSDRETFNTLNEMNCFLNIFNFTTRSRLNFYRI